ncbi:MAG TPA: NADH-ubiquinone oxidoreductase-F iron-sulfur binding region domain-containing protein [Acidimicrobiales bacterium]|nr:NADH-ubiquinone oxidoreductase-F iron-sulfur binding region domain-containing protein [Acidimicrobiales bacterium]
MTTTERVLPAQPLQRLADHEARGGGSGLEAARKLDGAAVIDVVRAAGMRGRGGSGFPTAVKWGTVAAYHSDVMPTTVVVNAAEGEPGCYKDRVLLTRDPYAVLEGALIAAHAVGGDSVIVAIKRTFTEVANRIDAAITELEDAGWCEKDAISIFEGPSEYLYGEETALLETIDGRYPFPRVTPPYRRGVDELVDSPADLDTSSSSAAHVEIAGATDENLGAPTLVSNAESLSHIPMILARGAEWFRSVGTEQSPGTIVCTISGQVRHPGVGELEMGTTLREAIDAIGGGPLPGREVRAVMSGVSSALVVADQLDTPLTYEAMAAIGAGLGAGGFLVYDETTSPVGIAAGVAHFLAVESCGQCRHCKQDGLELAGLLRNLAASHAHEDDLRRIRERLDIVADGARCNLPYQQQAVVGSVLERFPDDVQARIHGHAPAVEPEPIAAIERIDADGVHLDEQQFVKQPDWTHDAEYSGKWPADRLDEHRAPEEL